MSNTDAIEHLVEHTSIDALKNLLQNAQNLTAAWEPLASGTPSRNLLPHQNVPPQSNATRTKVSFQLNAPPETRPFGSQCSEDNLSNSQSNCAKVTYFDNNVYENILTKHTKS